MDGGWFQMTPKFPDGAWLPRLLDYAKAFPIFADLHTHLGLVIGIVARSFMVHYLSQPLGL